MSAQGEAAKKDLQKVVVRLIETVNDPYEITQELSAAMAAVAMKCKLDERKVVEDLAGSMHRIKNLMNVGVGN